MTAPGEAQWCEPPTPVAFAMAFRSWLADHGDVLEPFRAVPPPTTEGMDLQLRPLHTVLFEEGWTRWGWPAVCGGLGGSAVLRGVAYDELGLAGLRFPDSYLPLETLAPMMLRYAPALSAEFLPRVLCGDELWSQGFSEPDAGSDLASLTCRAESNDVGFVVTGQKTWVSFGHMSDRCVLLVRTGPAEQRHRALSLLLVDMDTPGVTVRPIRAASGRNDFSELFFDEVRVPPDRVIGEPSQGWELAMYLLQWERGMYAWQRQAALHSTLSEAVRAVNDAHDSETAVRIGSAYGDVHALRLSARRTLEALAAGRNPGPVISVDKLLLAQAEQSVFDVVRSVRAGMLELQDSPDAEMLRADFLFSRAAPIYGGSAEIQRSILADRVLALPRESS